MAVVPAELNERFPVVLPPKVRVCILVVAKFPSPVKKTALFPELAEIEAVGVPVPIMLRTANLAEAVLVAPSKRSSVIFVGARAPLALCQ
jgi:hypothetical protein